MMNPSTRLIIELEAQQWNVVLATLADGPFRVVASLIQEIQRQCNEQNPNPLPLPNGSLKEVSPP